jgi:aldehyde:ferredoxin oxidoreductase
VSLCRADLIDKSRAPLYIFNDCRARRLWRAANHKEALEVDAKGFNGKILKVNLTAGKIDIEQPEEMFYRKYAGGSALGFYYLLKEMPAGTDALAPESVIVLAPSVLTGAPVSGVSRFTVACRSPLGGAAGDSQCGGKWGVDLKYAGFDAVVVTGKSEKPVYLWVSDGKAELRDAGAVWGKTTGDARAAIRAELGDEKVEVACIGPAGEKLARFANISGGSSNYAGRTGAGAVMGSKNLKAVACRGARAPYEYADADGLRAVAKKGAASFENSKFHAILREMGTPGVVRLQAGVGNLCAKNFTYGSFDGMEKISGETLRDTIKVKDETCHACVVKCKNVVAADEPFKIDPEYGGPEFETIGLLGSNLLIDDIAAVAKGNEICNALGMDTISAGAMIAYAAECFENGLIDKEKTGGFEIKFGDSAAMLEALRMIGEREGLGDILAEGPERAIAALGADTAKFCIHAKGLSFPAHMAQVKMSQALTYAVNPFGADHMSSEHDWLIAGPNEAARGLALYEKRQFDELDAEKVKLVVYTQFFYSALDTFTLCGFCWGPDAIFGYRDLEDLVAAATGWKMTLWEIMKLGERRVNMMRAFNAREGFSAKDDTLPERMFVPIPSGDAEGRRVPREDFEKAKELYYAMLGWDAATGNPSPGKLAELGVEA